MRDMKMQEKRDSMEHRVMHMSVHCRAGMLESTRKSTRFPAVHLRRRICAKCVSSSNVMHDLRLCRVGISDSVRRVLPSWNNRRAGAPSAGLRLPWFCICTSLTVVTWTIISWCWLSVTNVFLTFTQVVQSVVLSIVLHWLYNNRQNVTPQLKNRFQHWLNAKHNTAFLSNICRAGRK